MISTCSFILRSHKNWKLSVFKLITRYSIKFDLYFIYKKETPKKLYLSVTSIKRQPIELVCLFFELDVDAMAVIW